jgi:hypothetical protein
VPGPIGSGFPVNSIVQSPDEHIRGTLQSSCAMIPLAVNSATMATATENKNVIDLPFPILHPPLDA